MTRIRAQGTLANRSIELASVTLSEAAGKSAANGSYDLKSQRFQVDAKGAGIDITRSNGCAAKGLAVTGKLGFSMHGSGTLDDPASKLTPRSASLALGGEPLASSSLSATPPTARSPTT